MKVHALVTLRINTFETGEKKHNIYKLLQLLSRSEYTVAFRMCRGSFQFQ